MTFRKIKNVFFVGIGGIGMSGIAEVLYSLGYTIQGSDSNYSQNIKRLEEIGITIFIRQLTCRNPGRANIS